MGERLINPLLNIQDGKRYKTMMIINPYRFGVAVDATSNVFLGTVSNLWSNPANWSRGWIPLSTERARIQATCFVDITTAVCQDLLLDNWELTVNAGQRLEVGSTILGNFATSKVTNKGWLVYNGTTALMPLGVLDLTSFLNTFEYNSTSSMTITIPNYWNLIIRNTSAIRTVTTDLVVNNNFELRGNLTKANSGSLLFKGVATFIYGGTVSLTGNPTIEFQNGGSLDGRAVPYNFGTGVMSFTTNNQTVSGNASLITNPIIIANSIIVTNTNTGLRLNGVVNGGNASSALNNNGSLLLGNSTLPMATGIFNYNNLSTSTLGFVMNGNYTLPYTSFANLYIEGTGIKTLSGNTTVTNYSTDNVGSFECSTFNLTVNGTFTQLANQNPLFSKNGAGTLIFVGLFTGVFKGSTLVSLTGNPAIEMRGGFFVDGRNSDNYGTGDLSFTTNNRNIHNQAGNFTLNNNATIAIGITITNTSGTSIQFNGILNGVSGSSIFDNSSTLNYQNATAPMVTGQLQTNNAANTFRYNRAGNQDVKGGTYRTIEFGGSGAKKLLGNVIINATAGGSQSTTGTATVDLNGFTITTI